MHFLDVIYNKGASAFDNPVLAPHAAAERDQSTVENTDFTGCV